MDLSSRVNAIEEFKKTLVPAHVDISEEKSIVTLCYSRENSETELVVELLEDKIIKTNHKNMTRQEYTYDSNWIETVHEILNEYIFDKNYTP